ncbi:short-chain dehydrogenase [Komagataeibacter rhaeticus]|uniref:SDR family NAD(P)-dependent oxidoreductase n=1 Tax=Komagataeibacter rhaeticus TaxID=215221 RepID=A0A181C5N1_9PROT|nr:SDR family NAD(P)-dependent oxidoreductase [Komagataeibacter rhaeticus]ATU72726.1 short-chain dehydrogenase [Komagataeibacter xylinus]EGG76593.1 Agropine synthesis reductase [Gluconacetobacter sp. SXCC-1]MBL7241219.1 SDR family NAD(P)-dependent oxidoreductase [Komagataeibacter rhaeticus]PYD53061.1 short-chain dehydrogenase [Komagataeibacter rhaeticus]QIP36555.1 SDR family NAD(P)-dependent oxidoreductase [Komagataeibacter rhaeticus]
MIQSTRLTDTGRVVMISGAGRGIGAAIAQRLAQQGWRISAGLRDPDAFTLPSPHMACHFDATDCESEQHWVARTLARHGRIDAVVANAGIMIPGSLLEVDDAGLERMLQVNVRSPARLVRAAWPALQATGQGRVIILSSLSGKRVKSPRSGTYAISKFAAVGLSNGIRRLGWADGIRSTVICPSFVATDMTAGVNGLDPSEMTQPDEIATMASMVLDMPNHASVSELCVTCRDEDMF